MKRSTPLKPSKILPRKVPMLRKSRPHMTPERKAARGKPCLLNVAGVCVYDETRVSLTHFRFLGNCGMGIKPSDLAAAPGCDACNHWTDSPTPRQVEDCGGRIAYERDRAIYAARALVRMRETDMEKAA